MKGQDKAEIFVVQRELAEAQAYPPDGLYETLPGYHGSELEADAAIAGERAATAYLDTDDQVYRVVKFVGEVVSRSHPKVEE